MPYKINEAISKGLRKKIKSPSTPVSRGLKSLRKKDKVIGNKLGS